MPTLARSIATVRASDPYEPPTAPAVEVRTDRDSQPECERRIIAALTAAGLV